MLTKAKPLPVGGPDGTPGAHAGGKRDGSLLAIGDSELIQKPVAQGVMP